MVNLVAPVVLDEPKICGNRDQRMSGGNPISRGQCQGHFPLNARWRQPPVGLNCNQMPRNSVRSVDGALAKRSFAAHISAEFGNKVAVDRDKFCRLNAARSHSGGQDLVVFDNHRCSISHAPNHGPISDATEKAGGISRSSFPRRRFFPNPVCLSPS